MRPSGLALIAGALAAAASAAQPGDGSDPLACVVERCAAEPVFEQWQQPRRLRYGYGMTGDDALAAEWYRRAAERGDARAMHNFGLMLADGRGVAADPVAGRAWLFRAMGRGVAESAFALGEMARTGQDAAPDPERARAYHGFAAERGHSRAMHALANMHAAGLGGPKSLEEAFFWYYLAAAKGHGLAARARDVAAVRLPDRVRRRAEARAEDWRQARRN